MLRFIFLFKITKAFHLINQTYELFYVSSNELLTFCKHFQLLHASIYVILKLLSPGGSWM